MLSNALFDALQRLLIPFGGRACRAEASFSRLVAVSDSFPSSWYDDWPRLIFKPSVLTLCTTLSSRSVWFFSRAG